MADLIDRQASIDVIHEVMQSFFCGAEDNDVISDTEKMMLTINKVICEKKIKALPSADVQPHQLTEEDLTELRHRFGKDVECVVRDMISGKDERWQNE